MTNNNTITRPTKTIKSIFDKKLSRWSPLAYIQAQVGVGYPTPANITYSWSFGSLAGLCLMSQILTGLFLSIAYTGHIDHAFSSIEYLSREIPIAVYIRYAHANGASIFFFFIYIHILRTLWYRAYVRNWAAWLTGIIIYFLSIATAFLGYVLPYGQISYWGATVITNLLTILPYGAGEVFVQWVWGGFSVGAPTLTRFFSFHFILPIVILLVVIIHLFVLHETGSSSPSSSRPEDGDLLPFFPYFFTKDLVTLIGFLTVGSFFVFFAPDALGHPDNYIEANPYVTPTHIVPEWYFLPFYAILRAIPHKAAGALAMIFAIVCFAFLPALRVLIPGNQGVPARSVRLWALNFILLGFLGACPAEYPYNIIAAVCTVFYFILLFAPIIIAHFINYLNYSLYTKNLIKNNKIIVLNQLPVIPNQTGSFESGMGVDKKLSFVEFKKLIPKATYKIYNEYLSNISKFSGLTKTK